MAKKFHTDIGYITITEAALITLEIMEQEITEESLTFWQDLIRDKAREGKLGGKRYKKRMWQVLRDDVIDFAKSKKEEKDNELNLFDFLEDDNVEVAPKMNHTNDSIEKINNVLQLHNDSIIDSDAVIEAIKKVVSRHDHAS